MRKPKDYQLLILTDTHLRSDYIPGFLDKQVETLTRLVNKKPPDGVIINGDIFHKRNPRGEELLAFGRLLDSFNCKDIFVNTGNHDRIKKDGSSYTTLSLFSDKARIITESETINIGGVNFDFIPHYEDESKIVEAVKKAKNHVFGHFGFEGCVSNGTYLYESKLKRWHFPKDKLTFLGHIHKPKIYDNRIHVLFEDILPKFLSEYTPDTKIFTLDDGVINDYLDSKDSIFSKDELMDALKIIKDDEN